MITIGPLPETDVAAMVGAMVGAPPGKTLRELVDALSREQALEISETARAAVVDAGARPDQYR